VPLPVQVDGEYVGERNHVLVEAVPDALSVIY
jgi:diacylglycerol kinase family enzyme